MGVVNYLRNVTKSIGYAVADIAKSDLAPNVAEFAENNKEFIASTYAILRNPSIGTRRSVESIQQSKTYQAIDYGIKNLFEDLKTGNFYNKEREDRDSIKFSGLMDGLDDNVDFNFDDFDNPSSDSGVKISSEITNGDIKIVNAIENSNAAATNATVNAILKTSNLQVKNSRANMGALYMQNEKLFGGLHQDLSAIGATMESMHKIMSASIQNIDKNLSNFFTNESNLSQERNSILKEMLELQRNYYTSAKDKDKKLKAKPKNNRWYDVNSNGLPDFKNYFEVIRSNISNEFGGGMMPEFSENSNMLAATYMASPLKDVLKSIVSGFIPATFKVASKELDKTISGVFGQIIAKLANNKGKDNLFGLLGRFFGVNTNVNRNVDTSRYEKGPVPFDGITRKAIIDVIPSYLRRIEARLSGEPEQTFDYDSGRWITVNSIKTKYESIRKNAIRNGTFNIREAMRPAFKAIKSSSQYQNESLTKAEEEFYEYLYDHNGSFNPNLSAEKNDVDIGKYPNFYKNYNIIVAAYKSFDNTSIKYRGGTKDNKNVNYSVRMQMANDILYAKDNEERAYRNLESKMDTIQQYMSAISVDSHGKWDKDKKKFSPNRMLLNVRDKLGNSIFDYLRNINKELTWQRQTGFEDLFGILLNTNFGGKGKKNRRGSTNNNNNDNNSEPIYSNQSRLSRINIHNTAFSGIDLETDDHKTQVANQNASENRKREKARDKALKAINSGEAIDMSVFEDDDVAKYMLHLKNLLQEGNSERFKEEIGEANAGIVSKFIENNFYRTDIKSVKDFKKEAKEIKERQAKNKNKEDKKEKNFISEIFKGIKKTGSVAGGLVGAIGDSFTNLLYAADKAIYEMMFKAELKNTDKDGNKKYKGFMDMITHKTTDAFNTIKENIKKDFIDPIKKWLGIDDKFKNRFKDELGSGLSNLWKSFLDSNKNTWGKAYENVLDRINGRGKSSAEKRRANTRNKSVKDLNDLPSIVNMYDKKFMDLMMQYDLNPIDYGTNFDAAMKDLEKAIKRHIYENTKKLKEVTNKEELNKAIDSMSMDEIKEIAKENNIDLPEDTNDPEFMKIFRSKMYKQMLHTNYNIKDLKNSKTLTNMKIAKASNKKNSDKSNADLAKILGFSGSAEEKIAKLKRKNPNKYTDEYINNLLSVDTSKLDLPNDASEEQKQAAINKEIDNRLNLTFLRNERDVVEDNVENNDETKTAYNNIRKAITNNNYNDLNSLVSKIGFSGTIEQKIAKLKEIDPNKYTDEYLNKVKNNIKVNLPVDATEEQKQAAINKEFNNILNLIYFRSKNKNIKRYAKGTVSGKPFMGDTMLSRNELLFNSKGVSRVEKTGAYRLDEPTHILNSEDSYDLMESLGVDKNILGVKSTIQQDLGRENLARKKYMASLPNHDKGTVKITNNGVDVNAKEIFSEAKKYIPEGAAGGLVGGILSMVLGLAGGPIIGAAAGVATSIIHNSDNLKEKLFGKIGENGKRDGSGIISKTLVDAAQRYAPDMFKYGLAGIIPGLITPLGPIGGLLGGAAIGFLKNNEHFTNKYFGENGKLTIGTKEKEIIQKMLPAALKGAGIGAVVGTLFGGPFGLLGNAALGSALGVMGSTEDFKDALLGEKINGVRQGGLLGTIKDAFKPLADIIHNFGKDLSNIFDKNVITPLSEFITPFIHQLPKLFGAIPRAINNYIEHKFHNSLTGLVKDFMFRPIKWALEKASKPAKKIANFVTAPFRLLGTAGRKLREHQIKKHDAEYMTADERINWLINNKKADKISDYDLKMADIGSGKEGALSVDQAKELMNSVSLWDDRASSVTAAKNSQVKEINKILDSYSVDGVGLATATRRKIRKALDKGNVDDVAKILRKNGLEGKGSGLTKEQLDNLLNGQGLKNAMLKYSDYRDRESRLNSMSKEDKDKEKAKAQEALKKLGFDVDLSDKKERRKFMKNLETEIYDREANADEDKEKEEQDEAFKQNLGSNVTNIAENIELITKFIVDTSIGENTASKEAKEERKEAVEKSIEKVNEQHNDRIEYAKKQIGEGKFKRLSDEVVDNVTSTSKDLNNRYDIRSLASAMTNVDANYRVTPNEVNSAGGDIERITGIKNSCDHVIYIFKGDAVKELNSLTDDQYKIVKKALTDYDIQRFCAPHYRVTKEDIQFLSQSSVIRYLRNSIYYLLSIGKKMKDYGSFRNAYSRIEKEKKSNKTKAQTNASNNTEQTNSTANNNSEQTSSPETVNSEQTNTSETINNATQLQNNINPPPTNGIGTLILDGITTVGKMAWNGIKTVASGIGSLAKGAFNLGKNAISSLFGGSKESGGGILSSIGNGAKNLFNKAKSGVSNLFHRGGSGGSQFDETDDPNDGKDVVQFGPTLFGKVKKDSSGNIEPDTSDSRTKEAINKLELDEKKNQEAQEAQIKASETLKDAFDVSDDPEAKKKGWSWWQLLLAGGFLWSSGALEKIYNGLIKPLWNGIVVPVWNNFLQPALVNLWNGFSSWFSETAWPWLQDVALPWFNDNILVPGLTFLLEALPDIIVKAIVAYKSKKYDIKAVTGDHMSNYTEDEKKVLFGDGLDENGNKIEINNDELKKKTVLQPIATKFSDYMYSLNATDGGRLHDFVIKAKEEYGITNEEIANYLNNDEDIKKQNFTNGKINSKTIEYIASDKFLAELAIAQTGWAGTDTTISQKATNEYYSNWFNASNGSHVSAELKKIRKEYMKNATPEQVENSNSAYAKILASTNAQEEESNESEESGSGNNVVNASLYALNKGYKETNAGVYPQFFVDYFNKNGYSSNITSDKNTLIKAINSGSPVVLMGQDLNGLSSANPYGKNNHYVTATGTDEFGNVIIQNPESPYDNQTYNADELMKKTKLGVYISDKSNTGRGGNNLNSSSVINSTKSVIDSTNNSISKTENEIINYKDDTETIINSAMSGKISVFSKQYWGNDSNNNSSSFANSIKNFNSKLKKMLYLPFILINNAVNKINGTDTTDNKSTNKSSNSTSNKSTIKDTMNSSFALKFITDVTGAVTGIDTSSMIDTMASAISGSGKYGRGYSKQIDPTVARIRFNSNGDSEYQTIGDSGCGPVAAVNAMEAMYGRGTNEIVDAASYALNHGYKETNGGTRPQFFTDYFSRNGYASQTTSNKSRLIANIRSGHPTVLMGTDPHGVSSSTPYGRYPHYVTVTGVDRFGRAIVQDPESKYDNQIYSMNDLMSKTQFGVSAFGRSKYNKINNSSFKHKKGQIYNKYNRPNKNIKYNKSKNKYGKGTDVNNIINQDLGIFSPLTAADINKFIEGYNSSSPFNGRGDIFIEASNVSGYDPRYILAHAALESGWGTSDICKDKGNYFGIGAFDGSAYESAYTFGDESTDKMRAGIIGGAKWIHEEYYEEGQTSLYLMQHCPFNNYHNYCTSSDWAIIIAEIMSAMPENTDATLVGSKYDVSSSSSNSSLTTSNATTGSSRYSSALKFTANDGKEYTIGQALNNALWNSNAGRVYSSMTSSSSGSGKYGRGKDDDKLNYILNEDTNIYNLTNKKSEVLKSGTPIAILGHDTNKKVYKITYTGASGGPIAATMNDNASYREKNAVVIDTIENITNSNNKDTKDNKTKNNNIPSSDNHPSFIDENGKYNFLAPFTYKEDDSKAPYSDEYREEKDAKIKENNKNALEEYNIKKSIEGKSIFEIFNDLLWNSNAGKVLSSINELSTSVSGDILNMKLGDSSSNTSSSAAYAPTTNIKVDGKTASGDPAKLVNIARGEIGTKEADHEGTEDVKYNHWYWGELSNYSGYPWCAAFVSWVADQAGVSTDIIPKSASCPTSYNTILNNGGVRIDPSQAGPGDIVYFTNDGSDRYHIGIVENRQGNTINTIEGNTGGEDGYMVARRQYNQGDSKLVIVHPAYQNTSGQSYDFTMTGEGGNGDKPLSKYGQFKNNIYGKSAMPRTKTIALKSKNGTYNVAYSAEDQLIDQSQKIIRDKNSNKYGKGTTVVSTNNNINTSLINTIINILYTIADNTDKLNTIVSILNQKLGINITSNDISNNSKRETLKAKLQNSLNNSLITSTSKINAYADDAADSSINFIIKAMNAIASE